MQTTKIGSWKGTANAGFVRRLILVPSTAIEDFPDPLLLLGNTDAQTIQIEDISINTNAQALSFNFPPKSCQYTLAQNQSSDGPLYNISIQGLVPKLGVAVTKKLEEHRNVKWVAFFQDHNQNFYIGGSPDYPLVLTYGQSINDQNNSSIFVGGRTPKATLNTNALPS